jgi:hypothetical protein
MKKILALSDTGFTGSALLIISYLVLLIAFTTGQSHSQWAQIIHSIQSVLWIAVFVALRYTLVNKSKLVRFKIVLDLIILLQIIIFLTKLIFRMNVIPFELPVPLTIMGAILAVLYIWLFIIVAMINKSDIKAASYLKYYLYTFLIIILASLVISFIDEEKYVSVNQLLKIIGGFSVIFLFYFFYKNFDTAQDPSISRPEH